MDTVINFTNCCFWFSRKMGLGLLIFQWKQQDHMVATRKKMPVFEFKLWANGKRTRLHFWMRESSNCEEHTEKEKKNAWKPLGVTSSSFQDCLSFYDSNNWGMLEENLRGLGNIFNFFWIWYGITLSLLRYWPEIRKSEIPPTEFCPISGDWE